MKSKIRIAGITVIVSALAFAGFRTFAMQEAHHGNDALLKALSKSKLSLAQGIQQATQGSAVPISAKFELDDKGQLSLSVYVAEKGLAKSAEQNVLKELSGSPESSAWTPETEVFKDVPHVARSAEQLTIMRLSTKQLLDIVKMAEKSGGGTVFSIKPEVENRKAAFEVLVANSQGKAVEMAYDLDGKPLAGHADKDDDDDKD